MQVEQISIEKKRNLIKRHLRNLNQADRQLRFFSPVANAVIDRYVDSLSDERDICFAILNFDRKRIVGLAHIARINDTTAELGMSVSSSHRGMGCGQLLMKRVALYCQAHRISDLKMECLRENAQMKCLAEKVGGKTISIEDGEVSALAQFQTDFRHRYAAILETIGVENQVFISKTFKKTLIRTKNFLENVLKNNG